MKKMMKRLFCTVLVLLLCMTSVPLTSTVVASDSGSSISIGDKITLGSYNGVPITWICVLIDENGPLMLSEDILCSKEFDAAGTDNFYHTDGWGNIRKKYGSNCWEDSNIRQWLNSKGTVNYTHCPPSYSKEAGFMTNFTFSELSLMKPVTRLVNVNIWESTRSGYCDGGSSDVFNRTMMNSDFSAKSYYYKNIEDTIFLLSAVEFNRIYNKNKNLLNLDQEYWLAVSGGNNSACYEHVMTLYSGVNLGSPRAYEKKGVRPAFYLNCYEWENAKQYEMNLYAGPGTSYVFLGKKIIDNVTPISLENGFCEIEYTENSGVKKRAYVNTEEIDSLDTSEAKNVVDSTSVIYGPYNNTVIPKIPDGYEINISEEISILIGPGKEFLVKDSLQSGSKIKIVYYIDDYANVEYCTNEGYSRGYIHKKTLNSESNEYSSKKLFDSIKSSNACFIYNGKNVYSTISKTTSSKWEQIISKKIEFTNLDWWGAITSAIGGNEIDADNLLVPELTPSGEYKANSFSALVGGLEMISNFFVGLIDKTTFHVYLEKNKDDYRLVIYTGQPFELFQTGKEYSLKSLMMKNQIYTVSEDEKVREMFPDHVKESGKYSMWFKYPKESTKLGYYGYSIVIENDGCAYCYPLFNEDTSFPVYRTVNGKTTFEFDAVDIYESMAMQLSEETTKRLLMELRTMGIESSFLQTSVKCPTDVVVYNGDKEVVAKTVGGNIVLDNSEDSVTIDVINSAKIIRYPISEEYSVFVSAYGMGSMNYEVLDIENAKVKSSASANNIEISTNDTYYGSVENSTQYNLIHVQTQNDILCGELNSVQEAELDVVIMQGGRVTGKPINTFKGQLIVLNAYPYEGYKFNGWYKDGEKISEETYLSFVLSDNMDITANFILVNEGCSNNHLEYTIPGISPTCFNVGLTDGIVCSICKEVIVPQSEISKQDHEIEIIPAVSATCTNTGLSAGKKCFVCGEIITEQIAIPKLPHNYSTAVTEATCEEGGFTTYTCSCGDTYTGDKIPAKGHSYVEGVCENCGESKVDNCTHLCHKSGFLGFIWKIVRFIIRLFRVSPVCDCGMSHY